MVLYSVEAVLHLAAVVDSDRLADGDVAPIAFAHIGLATVAYPVSGLAIAFLAWKLLPAWSLPQRPIAVVGILGGLVHTVSLPATMLFPDAETSPLFGLAAVMISVWAIGVGLIGLRAWRDTEAPSAAPVPA